MSGSYNDKFVRKVLVTGIPEEVNENQVFIHFQKKKNGGGDVERVTLHSGGRATVVFADPKVATAVVTRQQKIKEKVVEVKLLEAETKSNCELSQNSASSIEKEARTISVSGLPEEVTEKGLLIHFQKNKNGGGDIEEVTLLPEGKALVVFEDPEVAKMVINTEQIFKGNKLEVKGMERETLGEKAERITKDENSGQKEARTVLVSGLPEKVTKNSVHIHFQKKKNGGGDIEEITILPGGKALVVFEVPEVAKAVVNKEQMFQGNLLEVIPLETETLKENLETLTKDESSGGTKARTVFVSGLPEDATENGVFIHFQKRKNSGGEVEQVKLLGNGEAVVIFQEPQVAGSVVTTDQVFMGKRLVVKFQTEEAEPIAERSENVECKENSSEQRTVVVSDLPDWATENNVHIHFQKKGNGGGEIETTVLLPGNQALVVFEDSAVAKNVVQTPQQMKGNVFSVSFLNQESSSETKTRKKDETREKLERELDIKSEDLTSSESAGKPEIDRKMEEATSETTNVHDVDQMYAKVTASINPKLMTTGLHNFWSDVLDAMKEPSGVQCHDSAFGVLVTGSLSQVTRAGEILNLWWKRQRQNDPNLSQSNPTFNHTSFDQFHSGGIISPDDHSFNSYTSSLTHQNQAINRGDAANFSDNSFERGQPGSSGYSARPVLASEELYLHHNPNYPLPARLRERIGESNLQNEMQYNSDNRCSIGYRDRHYEMRTQHEMRYSHQPPLGLSQHPHRIQPIQFGYSPNTTAQYIARSPSAGETSNDINNRESAEQQTRNHQQCYYRQDGETIETTSSVGNTAPEVEVVPLQGTGFGSPVRSPNRNFNQQDYNQRSANHFTTERIPTASSADEGAVWPTTANTTTNYQSPRDQQYPYSSIKSNDQYPSFSIDKQSPPFLKLDADPCTSINSSHKVGPSSNIEPNNHFEKTPTNAQQAKTNPTARNQDGSDPATITECNQLPSPSSGTNLAVSSPQVSPDFSSANPQQKNTDHQPKTPEPPNEKQTLNRVESLLNNQADADHENAPVNATAPKSPSNVQQNMSYFTTEKDESTLNDVPITHDEKTTNTLDATTKRQQQNSGDQSDSSSDTNWTTSKAEGFSGETPGLTTEKSNTAENVPNSQPSNNQPHVLENLKNETACDNPISEPEIKTLTLTESDTFSSKKRTPVPRPRTKPKPGSRKNAAKFSSPSSKPTQPRQGSPSPKEPGSDLVADKPTTDSQATSQDENDETKKIKKLADEDNMEDEVD